MMNSPCSMGFNVGEIVWIAQNRCSKPSQTVKDDYVPMIEMCIGQGEIWVDNSQKHLKAYQNHAGRWHSAKYLMSYNVVLLSFLGQILPISGAWFRCSTFRTRSQQRRARDAGSDILKLSVVSPKNKFWCQDIDDRCVFWCYRNWIESQIYAVRCSRKFALQESTINKLRTLVIAIDHGVLSSALGYTHEEIIQICLCHWKYSLSISFSKLIALHRWLENMAGRLPKTWRTAHRWYFAGGLTFFSRHIKHPSSSIGLCFYVKYS